MFAPATENLEKRCPVCGRVFFAGEVAADAERVLTVHLQTLLRHRTDFAILTCRTDREGALIPPAENAWRDPQLLADTDRSCNADAVLAGYVYRFKERVGKGYAVVSPASVAFGVHLIRVKDGRSIWSGHFDETQDSLSKNLFQLYTFVKRKGKWLTAEELAISGLERMLEDFPHP
ncbi:MAG: hypothetical protein JSW39_14300 [Desulfobacterales bacterium]|nr:MAG: hypothetical protein JSW39_14300 [Desulfobacterales bacterium]